MRLSVALLLLLGPAISEARDQPASAADVAAVSTNLEVGVYRTPIFNEVSPSSDRYEELADKHYGGFGSDYERFEREVHLTNNDFPPHKDWMLLTAKEYQEFQELSKLNFEKDKPIQVTVYEANKDGFVMEIGTDVPTAIEYNADLLQLKCNGCSLFSTPVSDDYPSPFGDVAWVTWSGPCATEYQSVDLSFSIGTVGGIGEDSTTVVALYMYAEPRGDADKPLEEWEVNFQFELSQKVRLEPSAPGKPKIDPSLGAPIRGDSALTEDEFASRIAALQTGDYVGYQLKKADVDPLGPQRERFEKAKKYNPVRWTDLELDTPYEAKPAYQSWFGISEAEYKAILTTPVPYVRFGPPLKFAIERGERRIHIRPVNLPRPICTEITIDISKRSADHAGAISSEHPSEVEKDMIGRPAVGLRFATSGWVPRDPTTPSPEDVIEVEGRIEVGTNSETAAIFVFVGERYENIRDENVGPPQLRLTILELDRVND